MKLSTISMMFLMLACAAARTEPVEPWSVSVTSSGGITGKGAGSYSIDSAGAIAVTTMTGRSCSYTASAEELTRFRSIVANAKPASWRDSYIPENACCDRIEYELTLDEAGTKKSVRWIDDPAPMPKDLVALTNAMVGAPPSLRVDYGGKCQ